MQGKAEVLGEEKIVVFGLQVLELLSFLHSAPAGGTGFFAGTIVSDERHVAKPNHPDNEKASPAKQQGVTGHIEGKRRIPYGLPHGEHGIAQMVENLPRIGDEGFGITVTEIEEDRGDEEGTECRGGNLLIDFRVRAICHMHPPFPLLPAQAGAWSQYSCASPAWPRGGILHSR